MTLKSKILAAGLAAIIAGSGIFAANINTAQAQTNGALTDPTIAQMAQMIETLKQQIQQIIALVAQLKPLETCGNGFCRFGETAASCLTDCANQSPASTCKQKGNSCCVGDVCTNVSIDCIAGFVPKVTGCSGSCAPLARCVSIAQKPLETCGNGACETGETAASCPTDCGKSTSDNGKTKCLATGGAWKYSECIPGCGTPLTKEERLNRSNHLACASVCHKGNVCECSFGKYWASREEGCININININKPAPVCGNGVCDAGETAASCLTDCGKNDCYGEGEGEIGVTAGLAKTCCSGLTAQPRTTTHPNGMQANTEGFLCR